VILLSGSANPALTHKIAERLGTRRGMRPRALSRRELHVEIHESVRGRRVYLLQPTSPPVEDLGLPVTVVTLVPRLEEVIKRLDRDELLADLISHG
jgi:phosphoribosylpyrophosphate synthetase